MGVPGRHLKTDAKSSELDKVPITLKLMKVKIMIKYLFTGSLLSGHQNYYLNLFTHTLRWAFKIYKNYISICPNTTKVYLLCITLCFYLSQVILRFTIGLWNILTLILLMWMIWWGPNNASKWQVGFNSAYKRLRKYYTLCKSIPTLHIDTSSQTSVILST